MDVGVSYVVVGGLYGRSGVELGDGIWNVLVGAHSVNHHLAIYYKTNQPSIKINL